MVRSSHCYHSTPKKYTVATTPISFPEESLTTHPRINETNELAKSLIKDVPCSDTLLKEWDKIFGNGEAKALLYSTIDLDVIPDQVRPTNFILLGRTGSDCQLICQPHLWH